MRNILDNSCREYQNTFFLITFFFENLAVYEIMLKNMVEPKRPKMRSQHGRYALHAG